MRCACAIAIMGSSFCAIMPRTRCRRITARWARSQQLERHIGYDIGAKALCEQLADALDATLVMSKFSRLLIDPNRGEDDPTLIMRLSDGAVVPGNAYHDAAERAHRLDRPITKPYDDAIGRPSAMSCRRQGGRPVLFSLHSFTPIWRGHPRPWHAGVLGRDPRLAVPLIEALQAEGDLIVGDNEPYRGELPGDTMHRHGTLKGLPHALLEVRQDLIHDDAGVDVMGRRLTPMLTRLVERDSLRHILPPDER
jgi:predicted N-formylglutamate amidohydrolase